VRKNTKRRACGGFTFVEVVVATTVLLVFTMALIRISKSGSEAHEFNGRQNWLTEVGQAELALIRKDTTASVRLFTDDVMGNGYLARLDRDDYPALGNSKLPILAPTGTFRQDVTGSEKSGNILFFAKHYRTDQWTDPIDPGGIYRVDLYRFVAYYLRNAIGPALPTSQTGLDVVRWVSVPFADAGQVAQILDAAHQLRFLTHLKDGTNPADPTKPFVSCKFLWAFGSDLAAPRCFQEIQEDGTLQDRTMDVPFFRIPPDLVQTRNDRFWYRNASVATNNVTLNIGVGRFGIVNPSGDGFPHGFEVQVIGPAAARQVLVHLSLLTTHRRGRPAYMDASSVSDSRDL
jgi:hypothetical protein